MILPTAVLLLLATAIVEAGAFRLALDGRRTPRSVHANRFARRESIFGESTLEDSQDLLYYTQISLGSQDFKVVVDTGSSDLWVVGPVNVANDTGKTASLEYATGKVQGPIKTTQLTFSDYVVPEQAYIDATATSAQNFPLGQQGILGLGPSSLSHLRQTLNSTAGDPALDNIFRQNTSTPNFISFLLGRADVGSNSFPGDLTIGSVLPGYEAILNEPKLNVTRVANSRSSSQYWSVSLDKDGLIGPNGSVIPFSSAVSGSMDGRAIVVLDTGFSLPQVPKSVAGAIYSSIPGAHLSQTSGASSDIWQVPCSAELNISFSFGGKKFPVHPLDAVLRQGDQCVGAFQPVSFSFGGPTEFDFVGMAFLRNAYTLINFGDFVDGANTSVASPYVQLLSTTNDSTLAHQEFLDERRSSSSSRLSTKQAVALAAIVVGTLLTMFAAGCLLRLCYRRRKQRQRELHATRLAGVQKL